MTTYLHGDDLYDDSFSVETSSGEFLGETGVGISETIGAGSDAKRVTAFEVWLFDKNDIRTVTKVLMSDHAFNDDALRAKLAPKGEAVLGEEGPSSILRQPACVFRPKSSVGHGEDHRPATEPLDHGLAAWQWRSWRPQM
jgi:hypothetical protein